MCERLIFHPEKIARKGVLSNLVDKRVTYREDVQGMIQLRNEIQEKVKEDANEAKIEYTKRRNVR